MEYRRLGRSGLKVSAVSFGSWVTFGNQMDEEKARECLYLAYEHGVNFFDNAEVYAAGESERLMGNVLRKSGWGRDTFIVSSKVFWGGKLPTQNGLNRKHIFDACHAALKRLQVDYLDLYFCHRPDLETPIEETVRAMHDLIGQGKVCYWGTSEWTAAQIAEAHEIARSLGLIPPTMEQPQYNLFARDRVEKEYADLYAKYGMGLTIWSPLASGLLTGKYNEGIPSDSRVNVPGYEWLRSHIESAEGKVKLEKVAALEKLAEAIGLTVAQLSIAWCLRNPHVSTVILGASKRSQLEETLKAEASAKKITAEVAAAIEKIVRP